MPCLLLHYAEIDWRQLKQPNVKAILFMARKHRMNAELDEKLFAFLRENVKPLIGFCGGHQMIAQAFGGKIAKMRPLRPGEPDPNPKYYPGRLKEWGFTEVSIRARDPIFDGLPDTIVVNEMRAWEIVELPKQFDILASSPDRAIQVIPHRDRPTYGTQFHAEAFDDAHQDGKVILENFLRVAGLHAPSG
jgi:GMP synthase-like glutamine amidotransferase